MVTGDKWNTLRKKNGNKILFPLHLFLKTFLINKVFSQ